jgi:hypothetical protein
MNQAKRREIRQQGYDAFYASKGVMGNPFDRLDEDERDEWALWRSGWAEAAGENGWSIRDVERSAERAGSAT